MSRESRLCLDLHRGHYEARLLCGGYLSPFERLRETGTAQFSRVSPFTRLNSATLFVTSLSPRLRA